MTLLVVLLEGRHLEQNNHMKRTLKYFGVTIVALILWAVIIITGTLNGWWHKPITIQNGSEAYIDAVKEELKEQLSNLIKVDRERVIKIIDEQHKI